MSVCMHRPSKIPQEQDTCVQGSPQLRAPMPAQARPETYTSDQHAEQDVLSVALFPNILHIFRVSAATKWHVIPPYIS